MKFNNNNQKETSLITLHLQLSWLFLICFILEFYLARRDALLLYAVNGVEKVWEKTVKKLHLFEEDTGK